MALKGNLKDFSITQLLNLVNLAKKTGTLMIKGAEESARISFKEGKLIFAELSKTPGDLGSILYNNKVLTTPQYNTLQKRAASMSDKELGLLLINAGYVTKEKILESLQKQFIGIIQQLFNWAEGLFFFLADEKIPEGKIPARIDLENIIIESSRRIQELENLKDELPDLNLALQFMDRPGVNLQNINLSADEWRVVSFINPKNSMKQIAKAAKMSDLEIRRIVYSLLQAGLVELVRVEVDEPIRQLPRLDQAMPGKTKEEQKNLVNRLINRIRSI